MSSSKSVYDAIRFFLFPVSKYISDKTIEIDHRLTKIRQQKAVSSEMIQHVDQPDLLRSLVISMQERRGGLTE